MMPRLLKDEKMIQQWKLFFEDNYKNDIETIALSYPNERSLIIDYDTLDKACSCLADNLRNSPSENLFSAEEAIKDIDTAIGYIELHFRIENLPNICRVNLRDIRVEHVGKLISIDGLVKKRTDILPEPVIAAFQCQKCGALIREEQGSSEFLQEPSECYGKQGGCERLSTFKFIEDKSELIDTQRIQLQEHPEGLRGGAQPKKITVLLEDDLVDSICPGDRVCINGVLSLVQRRRGAHILKTSVYVIDACSIELKEHSYEEIEVTEEDRQKILNLSKDPEIYLKIKDSIAPAIHGLDVEKEMLSFQLFGGVPKTTSDGMHIRGDIHVLLIGDPGLAKSQLLHNIARITPRSMFCMGKGSSGAGLTASVVKDDFGDGQWTLDAGVLVLADMGIACIDELDKMREHDRDAIHPAMEQQEIHISKAGINATLKTRCAVLATANPKLGRFDEYGSIHEQINLPSTLISRFDVILILVDKPDTKVDSEMANHILSIHNNPNNESITPAFNPEFLRKYIAYAKQNIKPVLTDDAKREINNFYVKVRNLSDKSITITPRQLEALVRLSEASAKIRLSDKVLLDDAKRAIFFMDYYLRKVGVDIETGLYDYDRIATGHSHSQQKRMRILLDIVNQLCMKSTVGCAERADIMHETELEGIDASKIEKDLERLEQEKIVECHSGKYRVIL